MIKEVEKALDQFQPNEPESGDESPSTPLPIRDIAELITQPDFQDLIEDIRKVRPEINTDLWLDLVERFEQEGAPEQDENVQEEAENVVEEVENIQDDVDNVQEEVEDIQDDVDNVQQEADNNVEDAADAAADTTQAEIDQLREMLEAYIEAQAEAAEQGRIEENPPTETVPEQNPTVQDPTVESPAGQNGNPSPENPGEGVIKEIVDPLAGDDLINSQRGRGRHRGGAGADEFRFDTFDKFGRKGADKILDFNAQEGDFLSVSEFALPGLDAQTGRIDLATASNKRELRAMSKEGHDFIYFEKKGGLFYDGNGSDKGFGSKSEGGLMAVLRGKPDFTGDDLQVLA